MAVLLKGRTRLLAEAALTLHDGAAALREALGKGIDGRLALLRPAVFSGGLDASSLSSACRAVPTWVGRGSKGTPCWSNTVVGFGR